jgi:hypothetical protein
LIFFVVLKNMTVRKRQIFKNIKVREIINKSLKNEYLNEIVKVNSLNDEAAMGVLKK